MGTLNWEEFPPDLPLNVWVDETAVSRLIIAIAMMETPVSRVLKFNVVNMLNSACSH